MRNKRGFTVDPETDNLLDSMAFALRTTRSEIIDRAVRGEMERLSPEKRSAVAAAMRLSGGGRTG